MFRGFLFIKEVFIEKSVPMGQYRNEYDSMKAMMNLIRDYQQINEQINEGSIPALQPQELEDEKTRFSQAVTPNVQFGNWKSYNDTIEWSGFLIKEKIKWMFSLDQSVGCFISCEETQLSDDVVKVLQNLKAYYDQWAKYWGEQMSGRF